MNGTLDRHHIAVLGVQRSGKSTLFNSMFNSAVHDSVETSTSKPTGKALTGHIEISSHSGVKVVCTNMAGSVVGEYDLPIDARIQDLRKAIELDLDWHVALLDEDGKDVLGTTPLAVHAVLAVRQMQTEDPCTKCPHTQSPIVIIDTPGIDDAPARAAPAFDFFDISRPAPSPVILCSHDLDSDRTNKALALLEQSCKLLRRAQRLETKRRSLAVKSGDLSGPWSKNVLRQSLRMHKQNGPRRC
eukprot:TRINITY_DN791_c0_g2_i1.p1 TRINITY_DN791_c0_g2~~TRINITY_DN791_c0_g2_i1.p1  ORF type:complete len:244 (+),score=22.09 TRINITY_DN791_c0_g2_i1:62-793(+)